MLLSKRIAKLRKLPNFQSKDDSQTSKITKDTKKSLRCRFTEIPPPAKYVHSSSVHTILGDIPCMYYKGNLVTEISLYNEIKNYKDVTVTKVNDQAVITIKPTMKNDKDMPDWSNLTSVLSQTGNEEMTEWAKNIKSYCHTYSKVMQRQSRKKMKSGPRKQFFYQVTDYTNDLCNRLFENYPCLKLKFRIKNHQNQVKEILVNESLAKEMGYSVDGFVTNVLQEGLPQMMPYENPLASVVVKALIKNYFTIGDYGYEIGELACPLLMKSNFAKNMTFRTYFMMNYEDTVFGMDLIIAVTSVDEPYVLPKIRSNQELNADFVELMSSQEGEIDYFVSNFYDHSVKRTYTNFYKTCMLKEIGHTNDNSGDKDDDDNNDKNIGCKTEFQLKYEMNE